MSKLAKLRATSNAAPVAIFSSDTTKEATAIFERMANPKQTTTFEKKKPFTPIRFWLKKGASSKIVILDAKFSFGIREHMIPVASHYDNERCIAEYDVCPVCSNMPDSRPFDVAILSILDLSPYKNKEGVTVEYSKKVLTVKKNDLAAFQALMNKYGSLRGLVLTMTRGDAPKESSIGKPLYEDTLSEDDLLEEFGHEARVSDKGVVIIPENDSINPWNYEKYFPIPTKSELQKKYNFAPTPGSAEDNAETDPPFDLEEMPDDNVVRTMTLTHAFPDITE